MLISFLTLGGTVGSIFHILKGVSIKIKIKNYAKHDTPSPHSTNMDKKATKNMDKKATYH